MIIQDKKVQEFAGIMSNEKARLIFFTGPPGCGKNSLIDLHCRANNMQVVRYKDEQDSKYLYEALEMPKDQYGPNGGYPNDLENLIHYLRVNAKAQGSGSTATTGGGLKGSGFTAFKKSSFTSRTPLIEERKVG